MGDDDDDDVICKIKKAESYTWALRELIEPFPKLNTCNKLWKCNRRRPVYADHVRFDVIGNRDRLSTALVLCRIWISTPRVDRSILLYPWQLFVVIRLSAVEILNSNRDNQKFVDDENCAYLDPHCAALFNGIRKNGKEKVSAQLCNFLHILDNLLQHNLLQHNCIHAHQEFWINTETLFLYDWNYLHVNHFYKQYNTVAKSDEMEGKLFSAMWYMSERYVSSC